MGLEFIIIAIVAGSLGAISGVGGVIVAVTSKVQFKKKQKEFTNEVTDMSIENEAYDEHTADGGHIQRKTQKIHFTNIDHQLLQNTTRFSKTIENETAHNLSQVPGNIGNNITTGGAPEHFNQGLQILNNLTAQNTENYSIKGKRKGKYEEPKERDIKEAREQKIILITESSDDSAEVRSHNKKKHKHKKKKIDTEKENKVSSAKSTCEEESEVKTKHHKKKHKHDEHKHDEHKHSKQHKKEKKLTSEETKLESKNKKHSKELSEKDSCLENQSEKFEEKLSSKKHKQKTDIKLILNEITEELEKDIEDIVCNNDIPTSELSGDLAYLSCSE